jgi:hypothetical protein
MDEIAAPYKHMAASASKDVDACDNYPLKSFS